LKDQSLTFLVSDLRVADELPNMEDILKLRKSLQSMRVLCNHFLPCVVGKKRWKMQIQAGKKVNEIATVSDEAFALLVLENIWSDMVKVNIDDYYRPRKRKKKNNEDVSQESIDAANLEKNNDESSAVNLVKNTDANREKWNESKVITGKWTNAWRGSRRYGGWSPEGLSRFNRLVKMVIQDRENDTHFQAQYEIWLNEGKGKKKSKEKSNHTVVKAYRDLESLEI